MSRAARPSADLAAEFEALRPQLTRVAYGMLGSLAEAEDVVQEAWLRLGRADRAAIDDLRAWLTTVVGRLALDALGSARARRESYVGEWLPEPLVEEYERRTTRPSTRRSRPRCWSCSSASPPPSAPPSSSTTSSSCPSTRSARWSAARPPRSASSPPAARAHVEEGKPRFPADAEEEQRIVVAFALAWQEGDHEALLGVLDPEAVLRADGGGKVERGGQAARTAPSGSPARCSACARGGGAAGARATGRLARVNGAPGLVMVEADATSVVSLTIDAGRITAVDIVRNPEKLRGLGEASR